MATEGDTEAIGPNSSFFTAEMKRHLSDCHINFKKYKKLSRILGNIKKVAPNEEDMVLKFTNKCYGSEPDRKKAREQAKHFLDTLFGSCRDLFHLGPNAALEKHVIKAVNDYKRSSQPVVLAELLPNAATSDVTCWDGKLDGDVIRADSARGKLWTRKMKHYLIGPTLGVGGTAKVKLGLDTKNDMKVVAVKILKPRYAKDANREIDTLRVLKHTNVIQLFDEFVNVKFGGKEPTSVFVLEYASSGELIEYLMYTGKFEQNLARWMFHDLMSGVDYVHEQGFCHRDLKHDNCLLGQYFTLKITDFGFAAQVGQGGGELMKTAIGTEQYAAPEILKHQKYSKAVDIFAMGVMLFIALAGCQPFMRADQRDRWYSLIMKGDWKGFWKYHMARAHKFNDDSISLLQKMLTPHPSKRITLNGIKKHRFYSGEKFTQEEAAVMLQSRKNTVDKEKWRSGDPTSGGMNRDIPRDSPCAPEFWAPRPKSPFWFFSDAPAQGIQETLIKFVQSSVEEGGLGGVCTLRKVNDENEDFDLGTHLLSEGDFDTDEEQMADGSESPYNVKFHVEVNDKDVYGTWRIYCQPLNQEQEKKLQKKIKDIRDIEAQYSKQVKEAEGQDDENKAKVLEEAEKWKETKLSESSWPNSKAYLTDKDRESFKLYNIVIFNQWRQPNTRIKKIKGADGVKLGVRRKNYNKQYFPEVYKRILAEVAASLMVPADEVTEVEEKKEG